MSWKNSAVICSVGVTVNEAGFQAHLHGQFIGSGINLKEADEEAYFTLTKLADKSTMIAAHKKGHSPLNLTLRYITTNFCVMQGFSS